MDADPILAEIQAFCVKYRISPTQFGIGAQNDQTFVTRLKGGRHLRGTTRKSVKDFMTGVQNGKIDIGHLQQPTTDPIVVAIEAFMERHGMDATTFGLQAINDRALMTELKRGRILRKRTRERITQFMERLDQR